MKRNILFGSVLAAALSVGVGAQAQTGAQAAGSMAKSGTDAVTVTGCLQGADGVGGSATKSDPSKIDQFVLANPMPSTGAAGGATSSPSATAGTSGSTTPSATGSGAGSYVLTGGQKDELRTMANSKVEITGKFEDGPSAGVSNNGASSSAGTTGSAMSTGSRAPETKASGRTLKIDSIRKIAGTCS